MQPIDTLICPGGELKALDGAGKVGGYLVLFGDAEHTDASAKRDFFTPETDFGLDLSTKSRVLYNHGLDPELGTRSLAVAELKMDKVGVWMETQLKARDEYEKKILGLIDAGKQGLSSGTASHLVRRERQSNGAHKVVAWPLGLDASITPTPAEPRTAIHAIKSLAAYKAEFLGDHVERGMAMGALERLRGLLEMRLYDLLADDKRPTPDRLADCRHCLDEHTTLAMRALSAWLGPDADESEVKLLFHDASQQMHTGLRLASHLESVRAAVKGLSDRLASYAALRREEGRAISADRLAGIKALVSDLGALVSAAESVPSDEDQALYDQFLATSFQLNL